LDVWCEEVVMDLEMLFWAAVIARALSIPAVAYLAWAGQKAVQRLLEKQEQAWKWRGAEKRHEAGPLVPRTAN
jgi:hypothetical protein